MQQFLLFCFALLLATFESRAIAMPSAKEKAVTISSEKVNVLTNLPQSVSLYTSVFGSYGAGTASSSDPLTKHKTLAGQVCYPTLLLSKLTAGSALKFRASLHITRIYISLRKLRL